jgi:DNA-binding transcriptional LysR family regulator
MITGSIGAAAERLHLSQPAISKQLTALEHALDLRLFNRRSGRETTPTPDGIAYCRAIESTIIALEDLEPIARNIRDGRRNRIRIAATPPLINSAPLMEAVARFLETNPDVQISLEPRHRLDIEQWVVTRQIDIALALLPGNHPDLTSVPFVKTHAVVALRRDHPLAELTRITADDLISESVILPSQQPLRVKIDAALDAAKTVMRPTHEATSATTCCRMALTGLGVTICDPFSPTAFGSGDLVTRPWHPNVALTYGVLVNRSSRSDDMSAELMELLRDRFVAAMSRTG